MDGSGDPQLAIRTATERADYWKSLYGLTRITERYLVRWLDVHVHLTTRYGAWCAKWERHPGIGIDGEFVHDEHDVVFVGVMNLVEEPEWVEVLPVPSLIRLRVLDACGVLGLTDFAEFMGSPLVRQDRQLANEVVEGRAQVVGDFPDGNRPSNVPDEVLRWFQHQPAAIRVGISDSGRSHLTVEGSLARDLERVDVFFGDCDLLTRSVERMHQVKATGQGI